jgi:transposase
MEYDDDVKDPVAHGVSLVSLMSRPHLNLKATLYFGTKGHRYDSRSHESLGLEAPELGQVEMPLRGLSARMIRAFRSTVRPTSRLSQVWARERLDSLDWSHLPSTNGHRCAYTATLDWHASFSSGCLWRRPDARFCRQQIPPDDRDRNPRVLLDQKAACTVSNRDISRITIDQCSSMGTPIYRAGTHGLRWRARLLSWPQRSGSAALVASAAGSNDGRWQIERCHVWGESCTGLTPRCVSALCTRMARRGSGSM